VALHPASKGTGVAGPIPDRGGGFLFVITHRPTQKTT